MPFKLFCSCYYISMYSNCLVDLLMTFLCKVFLKNTLWNVITTVNFHIMWTTISIYSELFLYDVPWLLVKTQIKKKNSKIRVCVYICALLIMSDRSINDVKLPKSRIYWQRCEKWNSVCLILWVRCEETPDFWDEGYVFS